MDRKETAYYVLYQPKSNNCSAVVSYMAGYFKKAKQYYTSIKDLAIGDIVFFQNSKGLSHVGICVDWSDSNKTFKTIEGNKGDKVDYGEYKYSDVGGYVAGFGKPRYTDTITRKAALEYAKSQIGYTEGSNNWNKYADELDKIDYFAGCGKKQNLPWCAVFICAVMYNSYCVEQPAPTPTPTPTPETKQYKVKTNGGTLTLRADHNVSSPAIEYINNGTTIDVTEIVKGEPINNNTDWAKTRYKGKVGYCSCNYLVPVPKGKTYKVKVNSFLNVRKGPGTNYASVGRLYNGNTVTVYATSGDWGEIGESKWVCMDYLV